MASNFLRLLFDKHAYKPDLIDPIVLRNKNVSLVHIVVQTHLVSRCLQVYSEIVFCVFA